MASRRTASGLAAAAGTDVSQQGVQLLRALSRHGELPVARLARAAQMDLGAVSRQVRRLEGDGLVRRSADDDDGRVVRISLTTGGADLARRIHEVGVGHLADALAGWDPRDVERLTTLMGRLVDDLVATPIPTDLVEAS